MRTGFDRPLLPSPDGGRQQRSTDLPALQYSFFLESAHQKEEAALWEHPRNSLPRAPEL